MDRQAMRLRHDVRFGFAGRRLEGIVSWPVCGGRQIVEIGRHERQRAIFPFCSPIFLLPSLLAVVPLLEWPQIALCALSTMACAPGPCRNQPCNDRRALKRGHTDFSRAKFKSRSGCSINLYRSTASANDPAQNKIAVAQSACAAKNTSKEKDSQATSFAVTGTRSTSSQNGRVFAQVPATQVLFWPAPSGECCASNPQNFGIQNCAGPTIIRCPRVLAMTCITAV